MGWKTAGLIRVSGLTDGTDVDVLEAIASFLNEEDGRCFPALESVMLVARKSRNIVRQSIKALCEQGLLSFSAEPGKVRSYVIHVHNLPEPKLECFKEFFRTELGKKGTPVQKLTGFRSEPGSVVNGEGVQKCTPTGFRSEPGGGSEVNPEQGINREIEQGINRERNREVLCALPEARSANAAVASAQAQTPYPEDFDQSLFEEAMLATQDSEQAPEALPDPDADLPPKKQRRSQQPRVPFPETLPDDWAEAAKIARPDIDPQRVFLKLRARYAPTTTKKTLATWKREFMNWIGKEFAYDNRYRSSAQKPQRTLGATDTRSLNHRNFGKWASHAV
jgi:hypothetical protein